MAHPKRTVYDLLAKRDISEVTAAHLDASVSSTRVDKETIDFWTGPITLHRVLEMRTYPHGLPIPESGAIQSESIEAGGSGIFLPSGTEEWKIMAISIQAAAGTPDVDIFLSNGVTAVLMHSGTTSTSESNFMPLETPFIITSSLYLLIVNTDLGNAIIANIAYHMVGL